MQVLPLLSICQYFAVDVCCDVKTAVEVKLLRVSIRIPYHLSHCIDQGHGSIRLTRTQYGPCHLFLSVGYQGISATIVSLATNSSCMF